MDLYNINMSTHDTQPLNSPPFHDVLPSYISADKHTRLDKLAVPLSSTTSAEPYDCVSALIPPFREEDGSVHSRQYKDGSFDGIPAHLRDHDAVRTRMRLIRFRIYLMRCEVLQSTINALERKSWGKNLDRSDTLDCYYSKIRHQARKLQQLAEALDSLGLQARCEYWTGRGNGGLKDWEAAKSYFAAAIKLDVPNVTYASGRTQQRGLLQHEKDDVESLLQSVT
jgi:hypothetical protein